MKVALTDITIKNLKPEPGKQVIYLDKSLPGFGVRVTPKGAKSYVLTYGKERKRLKIGDVGLVGLQQARKKARDFLAHRQLHGDAPQSLTFGEAVQTFLKTHCLPNNKPSTYQETKRLLERHFATIEHRSLPELKTGDVTAIIDGLLPTPSEANHTFTAVRTLLRWAVRRRHIPHNPLEGLKLPAKAVSRARVLSDTELGIVWHRAQDFGEYGQIIQLLLLTGQRLNQILNMPEPRDGLLTWSPELMKHNQEHTIPCTSTVEQILETFPSPSTFTNWSTAHKRFLKECAIPHFTRHDLRRVFSTSLARQNVAPHITERLLAHTTGSLSPIAKIYNKYSYMDEMRDALTKHERYLDDLRQS